MMASMKAGTMDDLLVLTLVGWMVVMMVEPMAEQMVE